MFIAEFTTRLGYILTLATDSLDPWSLHFINFLISLILFADILFCFLIIELSDIPEQDDSELEEAEQDELLFDPPIPSFSGSFSLTDMDDIYKIVFSDGKFTKDTGGFPSKALYFSSFRFGTSQLRLFTISPNFGRPPLHQDCGSSFELMAGLPNMNDMLG